MISAGDTNEICECAAALGGAAESVPERGAIVSHATSLLARTLGVRHVLVLRLDASGRHFRADAGLGWAQEALAGMHFENVPGQLFGAALAQVEPLAVERVGGAGNPALPEALSADGLGSALCVGLRPDDGPAGVLAVFSERPCAFTVDDVACLSAVAAMVGSAFSVERAEASRRKDRTIIEQAKQEWEATVDALPQFICLLDGQGRIVRANRSIELWGRVPTREVPGRTVHEVLHPGCDDDACYMATRCAEAWKDIAQGRHCVFEVHDPVLNRQLEVQVRPTTPRPSLDAEPESLAVLVLQDITRIKSAEDLLKDSNYRLEQAIKERTEELVQANEQLRCEVVERRRAEEDLRRSENDLRLLSAQLLTAQEMERKRIAAELHDSISQSLTAIKFSIENAVGLGSFPAPDERTDLISPIISRMQTAIDEVHRISMDLRPAMLDELGVIPTIAWFCREFRSIYAGIQLNTYVNVVEHDIPISLKTVIYRILQEALNNVAKHANAEYAGVHLDAREEIIEFMVQDNGRGFETDPMVSCDGIHLGSGIASMRERVEFSGGEFALKTASGAGTMVRASWPRQHRTA